MPEYYIDDQMKKRFQHFDNLNIHELKKFFELKKPFCFVTLNISFS